MSGENEQNDKGMRNDDILVYNDDTTSKIIVNRRKKEDEDISREVEKLFVEFTAVTKDYDEKGQEEPIENVTYEKSEETNETNEPSEDEFLQGKDF